MSGNSDKLSGGTRNYASQPGTHAKRSDELNRYMGSGDYSQEHSYFDKSGGFMVVHSQRKIHDEELKAGRKLAQKGYKVYLDRERSTISGQTAKDGRLYKSPMDIKAISKPGKWTLKSAMEYASKQGAETVVVLQQSEAVSREYISDQIQAFRDYSPQRAKAKIKRVIVVGMSGRVHRRRV